jgi:hypothetical protein
VEQPPSPNEEVEEAANEVFHSGEEEEEEEEESSSDESDKDSESENAEEEVEANMDVGGGEEIEEGDPNEEDVASDDEEYALRDGIFVASMKATPKATKMPEHQAGWYGVFVRGGTRISPMIPPNLIRFVIPDRRDRAHHHRKGLSLYQSFPNCGFRLPLSPFVQRLLIFLDVAPGQLTPPSWCHISSFEELFKQVDELKQYKPTLEVFFEFFRPYHTSTSHLAIRQKSTRGKNNIFDSDRNPKVKKVESWKKSFIFIENSREIPTLERIRRRWRCLEKHPLLVPNLANMRELIVSSSANPRKRIVRAIRDVVNS